MHEKCFPNFWVMFENLLLGWNTKQCQVWVQTIVIAQTFKNSKLLKNVRYRLMSTIWEKKRKSFKDVKTCGIQLQTGQILLFVLKYNILRIFILIFLEIIPLSHYYGPSGCKLRPDTALCFAPAANNSNLWNRNKRLNIKAILSHG